MSEFKEVLKGLGKIECRLVKVETLLGNHLKHADRYIACLLGILTAVIIKYIIG